MNRRIKRLTKSFKYASKGLHHALMTQQNIWIHVAAGTIVLIFAIVLGFDSLRLAILLLTIAMVLILEMINTVAETIVDLSSPEFSELGRIAKDVAAGAVLLAAFFSVVIAVLLFFPFLFQ
ncbi:MAG: diacylglycerol kinase family protein [bacterium]